MRPIDRGNAPVHITSRGIQPALSETYSLFKGELIQRLGEYCSYCEVPLGANLAIEHVLPKTRNLNEENAWSNFLLSCINCNSSKGSKEILRADYYWPDDTAINLATSGFNTFSMLEYYFDQPTQKVLLKANPGSGANVAKVDATIKLTGLNKYDDTNLKVSDRRVTNRTNTWNAARRMATTLSNYYTSYSRMSDQNQAAIAAAQDPAIIILKRQITIAALAAGFWSVWMTIFKDRTFTFINDTVRDTLLTELFVRPFPGTRYP
ncbi:MAG: HNH endonuclease [Ktedonobacteraceae bacterium]